MRVHRHERALHLWNLAHRPAVVLALNMDDIPDRPDICRGSGASVARWRAPDPLAFARQGQTHLTSLAILNGLIRALHTDQCGLVTDIQNDCEIPAVNVARSLRLRQQLAPDSELSGSDFRQYIDRPQIGPLATVILFQRFAQGRFRMVLEFVVDGCPDRQAAVIEFLGTHLADQLATHLPGEVTGFEVRNHRRFTFTQNGL